jgi:hypothetical protein
MSSKTEERKVYVIIEDMTRIHRQINKDDADLLLEGMYDFDLGIDEPNKWIEEFFDDGDNGNPYPDGIVWDCVTNVVDWAVTGKDDHMDNLAERITCRLEDDHPERSVEELRNTLIECRVEIFEKAQAFIAKRIEPMVTLLKQNGYNGIVEEYRMNTEHA